MQKFIKSNNQTVNNVVEERTSSLHPSQVKLVGYLKKKRNKVGGWRKMWFVLQNQLLLSYPSKEDYDKKLVSFKDALNLVPGTVVRPLGGYRFAIQTTSESVFIFRCDDNKTYMEWITALVDSLSIGSKFGKQKKDGMVKRPLQGSHSCSSLVRSKKNKAVQIPIAHGTARILNRTGLSENDLRAFSMRENNQRSNHFCLHESQFLLKTHSDEVSRINRMFCGSASSDAADTSSTTNSNHSVPYVVVVDDFATTTITGNSDKGFTQPTLTPRTTTTTATKPTPSTSMMKVKLSGLKGNQCESESGEVNHKSVINRKFHDLLNYIKSDSLKMNEEEDKLSESDFARDINSNRRCELKKFLDNESKHQNGVGYASNVTKNILIEDQVQRLSLQGSSAFKIDDRKNISLDEKVNCLRLSSTIRRDESSSNSSPFSRHRKRPPEQLEVGGCSSSSSSKSTSSSSSGSSSTSSSAAPSSGRTIESLSCNDDNDDDDDDDDGSGNLMNGENANTEKKNEPIYAVVDLKNKYEHRARIRHQMEEKRKSLQLGQINDLDEVTTDYEEVLNFPNETTDDNTNTTRNYYDEENIYEPINIPDPSLRDPKHRNVLWKYISRLNIDTLFELAKNRKRTVKSNENTSPFANIKQKIGHHRKSLRIRMIKLYARDNHQTQTPTPLEDIIIEKIDDDIKLHQGQE